MDVEGTRGLFGERPLQTAAEYDSAKVAKVNLFLLCIKKSHRFQVLIEDGADIEEKSQYQGYPLHIASQYNSARVARVKILSFTE